MVASEAVRPPTRSADARTDIVVPLRSKRQRRSLLLQKLNHVIPAIGLFFAGMQAVGGGHEGVGFYLGVFELVSSAALVVLFLREARAAAAGAHHDHHGVDWVDIAAGFVLLAEVLEHWHLTHRIQRPTLMTAITTFAIGLFQGRLVAKRQKRRVLRVTSDGVSVAGRVFKARRLDATWAELRSIDVGPRWAVVTTRAGRARRLDLPDFVDEVAMRGALLEARSRLSEDRSAADR